MPSYEVVLTFIAATAVFAYLPGPGMLYTTARTIARGPQAGLMASFGLHLGGYIHVVAAVIGLSALFKVVPSLYLGIKLAGAVYLIAIGVRLICRRGEMNSAASTPVANSGRHAFVESIAVEVLNPKTALFFVAFLPQFADPAAAWPIWLQLLALGTIVNIMFSSADLLCVALAGALLARLRSSIVIQRIASVLGGTLLIALGLRLAFQRHS